MDILADFYHPLSIKTPTRQQRGTKGARCPINEFECVPADLLANSDNKEELNKFIAYQILNGGMNWDDQYCVTYGRAGVGGNM